MKKAILIFSCFMSFCAVAQTLHIDDLGVKVFYEIQQTDKYINCKPSNASDKKIIIWSVSLAIKNGYNEAIVPRGVGIANITVNPSPLKPYTGDYCNYNRLKNYEPTHGNIDQSLFIWSIRNYKISEIKAGAMLKNTTYLYLYEGQTPTVTNSQFLGYRLLKDFKDTFKISSSTNTASVVADTLGSIATFKNRKVASSKEKDDTIATKTIINSPPVKAIKKEATTTTQNKSNTSIPKCPDEKTLEYKNKVSSNINEQKAYSWLAIYYKYKCECDNGSQRADQLVAMINNIVDSYIANTYNAYGVISKVSKCNPLIVKLGN